MVAQPCMQRQVKSLSDEAVARPQDDLQSGPDQPSRLAVSSNLEGFLARALDDVEGEPDQASRLAVSPNLEGCVGGVLDKVLA